MESHTGSHIEVEVCVMHPMHPPEQRNRVEHHVLQIYREIQEDERCRNRHVRRQSEVVEQAPLASFGLGSEPDCACRNDDAHQNRIEDGCADVTRPERLAAICALTARRQRFSQSQRQEDRDESAETD
jgi:hypothetical protein